MPQRIGALSRLTMIKEDANTALGTDPASPVRRVVPLFAEDTFSTDQPRTPSKIYDGTRKSKGSTKGMIAATGGIPASLDFRFIGLPTDVFFGHGTYRRTGSLHQWFGADDVNGPGAVQLQREHLQGTPVYHRNKGVRLGTLEFAQEMSGQAHYTMGNSMGVGSFLRTNVGGTLRHDGPFVGYNFFDGAILKANISLTGVTAFTVTETNQLSRQDAAFRGGMAAGVNAGVLQITGSLALIFDTEADDAFLLEALDDVVMPLEWYWTDKPVEAGPTMWYRRVYPAVLFGRGTVHSGGDTGKFLSQTFVAQVPDDYWPGEFIFGNPGPYALNIADSLVVNIDGGADIPVTLTDGPTQTAANVAADLNADVPFAAVATASAWNGRVKIASKDVTVASKVKIAAATTAGLTDIFGLDVTERLALPPSDVYAELKNDLEEDY